MDVFAAIRGRRTIRKFLNRGISDKDIRKIIDAAHWAPSGSNVQGWKFIVIRNKKVKQRIVDGGAASFILGAPIGIVVVYDNRIDNIEYQDHIQSASAAIQNMLLAAWSLNIGCCWVCHLPLKKYMRKVLKIPDVYDPIAYLAMGYFEKKKIIRPRKLPVEELISYNKFRFKVSRSSKIRLWVKRMSRRIYYLLPFRKYIKPYVDRKFEKKFD